MVKKQTENRLNDYVRTLIMQRSSSSRRWISTGTEFQERQKEQAIHDVKVALVLEHIAEQENISVTRMKKSMRTLRSAPKRRTSPSKRSNHA